MGCTPGKEFKALHPPPKKEKEIKCPFCGKNLGESTWIDMQSIGWICTNHIDYQVRITKEYRGRVIYDNK
jgi:hypothetical protein